MRVNKFSAEGRRRIYGIIKKYIRENPSSSYEQIAEHLNKAGIKHVNKDRWSLREVNNFLYLARRGSVRKGVIKPAPAMDDSLSVAEIVLASKLDAGAKKRILAGLFA